MSSPSVPPFSLMRMLIFRLSMWHLDVIFRPLKTVDCMHGVAIVSSSPPYSMFITLSTVVSGYSRSIAVLTISESGASEVITYFVLIRRPSLIWPPASLIFCSRTACSPWRQERVNVFPVNFLIKKSSYVTKSSDFSSSSSHVGSTHGMVYFLAKIVLLLIESTVIKKFVFLLITDATIPPIC